MKHFSPWLELLILLLIALGIGATFRYPLVTDDPFITYRYARNLLDGQGFVFNPGEHVLSTTTPLYTLVLAIGGLLFRDLPTLGFWLSVVGFGIGAWFLYLLASELQLRIAGFIAAVLMLVSSGLILTFGLETGFYLALALGAIYFYFRGRTTLAFALLALLTLTRNDGILLAAILSVHFLWMENGRVPRSVGELVRFFRTHDRPFVVFVLILLPWLGFAWWWFGAPFPFTLTAKIAQAQSGLWDTFAIGFARWLRDWVLGHWLFAACSLVGLAFTLGASHHFPLRSPERRFGMRLCGEPFGFANRIMNSMAVLVLWAIAHIAAYSLLGVAFYAWYIAPVLPALALLAGIGVELAARGLATRSRVHALFPITLVLVGGLLGALELRADLDAGMQQPSPKVQVYRRAAEWIAQNTSPTATVDALEVGVMGYYDRRRTLDFVGLVDPTRVPYLRIQALSDGVRRAAADYVIAIPPDEWLPLDPWFKTDYIRVQEFRAPGFYGGKPLVIYRRADVGHTVSETRTVNLAFDRQVELQAVDLFAHTVNRGDALPLILHLRATEPLARQNKFTLQVVGAANRIIAQSDTYYPLRLPENGQPFLDHQALQIPRTAPPGKYDLILAFYNSETGERANLYDAQGNAGDDFLSLGQIEIH